MIAADTTVVSKAIEVIYNHNYSYITVVFVLLCFFVTIVYDLNQKPKDTK